MKKALIKYLQYGTLNKWDAFFATFFPSLIELKNANRIFSQFSVNPNKEIDEDFNISIPSYTGDHSVTKQIKQYLEIQNHPAIYAALVHGSIASEEVIPYSDFDGILIIDPDQIVSNIELFRLREIIQESSMLMYKMDGLQHHHWTILLKEDLLNFRDDLLPSLLIENSKVLFPSRTVNLKLEIAKEELKYSDGFYKLKRSIENKLLIQSGESNFYTFKNLLSEILLLPTMFIQSVNKKGTLKKNSFTLAPTIIPAQTWKVINEVSALRTSWNQDEVKFRNEIKASKYRYLTGLQKRYRTPLPFRYNNWFSEKRIKELSALMEYMQNYIEKNPFNNRIN